MQPQTSEPLLDMLGALQLRYFTPGEAAALHGFPPSFRRAPVIFDISRWDLKLR